VWDNSTTCCFFPEGRKYVSRKGEIWSFITSFNLVHFPKSCKIRMLRFPEALTYIYIPNCKKSYGRRQISHFRILQMFKCPEMPKMNEKEVHRKVTADICVHGWVTTMESVYEHSQKKYHFSLTVLTCVTCHKSTLQENLIKFIMFIAF
jgi:hypothetical protein